ncbi:hypothetical protein GRJ2_002660800 [Grus japonensis]|uniref:Uncharacterized protein n=1 Tax=Grus japonensis TaxID=30415 RepID=A0ABC9XYH5_GRUJA
MTEARCCVAMFGTGCPFEVSYKNSKGDAGSGDFPQMWGASIAAQNDRGQVNKQLRCCRGAKPCDNERSEKVRLLSVSSSTALSGNSNIFLSFCRCCVAMFGTGCPFEVSYKNSKGDAGSGDFPQMWGASIAAQNDRGQVNKQLRCCRGAKPCDNERSEKVRLLSVSSSTALSGNSNIFLSFCRCCVAMFGTGCPFEVSYKNSKGDAGSGDFPQMWGASIAAQNDRGQVNKQLRCCRGAKPCDNERSEKVRLLSVSSSTALSGNSNIFLSFCRCCVAMFGTGCPFEVSYKNSKGRAQALAWQHVNGRGGEDEWLRCRREPRRGKAICR